MLRSHDMDDRCDLVRELLELRPVTNCVANPQRWSRLCRPAEEVPPADVKASHSLPGTGAAGIAALASAARKLAQPDDRHPASHIHDRAAQRWETFDADRALAELSDDEAEGAASGSKAHLSPTPRCLQCIHRIAPPSPSAGMAPLPSCMMLAQCSVELRAHCAGKRCRRSQRQSVQSSCNGWHSCGYKKPAKRIQYRGSPGHVCGQHQAPEWRRARGSSERPQRAGEAASAHQAAA